VVEGMLKVASGQPVKIRTPDAATLAPAGAAEPPKK
jgi:hypothetical protein